MRMRDAKAERVDLHPLWLFLATASSEYFQSLQTSIINELSFIWNAAERQLLQ